MVLTREDFVSIVAGVLGLEGRVTADDNFLELGGDSLAAIRVAREIRRRTGSDVSLRAFFEETELDGVWHRTGRTL